MVRTDLSKKFQVHQFNVEQIQLDCELQNLVMGGLEQESSTPGPWASASPWQLSNQVTPGLDAGAQLGLHMRRLFQPRVNWAGAASTWVTQLVYWKTIFHGSWFQWSDKC